MLGLAGAGRYSIQQHNCGTDNQHGIVSLRLFLLRVCRQHTRTGCPLLCWASGRAGYNVLCRLQHVADQQHAHL